MGSATLASYHNGLLAPDVPVRAVRSNVGRSTVDVTLIPSLPPTCNAMSVVLKRRVAVLSVALVLRNYEWTLHCKLVVAIEKYRIREQLQLQNAARCRVWASAFNINALSDRECLMQYRVKRQDVGFISDLIPWETSLDPQGKMRTMRRR
jgi:hypothetical protein